MTATTFPYGYGGALLTWDELLARNTVNHLHPEFLRRVRAMCEDASARGVPLGIGEGWRVTQPTARPGFASPGNSNHESFPARSGAPNAVAADMVPGASWDWMEGNCIRFGLRTFRNVNSEPWHVQPAEIPASRNFRSTPWDLRVIELPDDPSPPPPPPSPPPPPPSPPPPPPPVTPKVAHVTVDLPYLQLGVPDQTAVGGLQRDLNDLADAGLAVDNNYGPRTKAAVENWQRFFGLYVDGEAGGETQGSIIAIRAMHNFAG